MRRTAALLLLLIPSLAAAGPDPASVRRYGPAYRYPQAGWTVLHVEGAPYDRGYQHGRLMATEIGEYVKALAIQASGKAPADAWRMARVIAGASFVRKFDRELLEEMQGIADGAAAGGAAYDGRPIDLLDVVTLNIEPETMTLDAALDAQPTGLEGVRFPTPPAAKPKPRPQPDHCSAFAVTGPATADGKIVFGHITMWSLASVPWYNVWLDVKPAAGHRVTMQAFPGGIWSGMDYYVASSGLMLTETTIRQTRFNPDGVPLASRVRRAMQYATTIDGLVKELTERNNGLYANEWLIGDANTNEIAVLELGTTAHRLRRSSRNEWILPGAEGFYWGCNNTKDLRVRLDTLPGTLGRPEDVAWVPSVRDKTWLKLFAQHRGKIDLAFGKLAFTTPPLAARPSLDAKLTTTELAKGLRTVGVFGPPVGTVWHPTPEQRTRYPGVRALVPNDWTELTPDAPAAGEVAAAVDFTTDAPDLPGDPHTAPAWHGVLVPKTDADVWLTAGFAGYERIVALENALKEKGDGKLSKADRERVEHALFRYRTDLHAARTRRPAMDRTNPERPKAEPLSPLDAELVRDDWHRIEAGYGVLTLHALRGFVGADRFDPAMDTLGREYASKPVSATAFLAALGKATEKDVAGFLKGWAGRPEVGRLAYSVRSFADELESVLIVYGTTADAAANKEAAYDLQRRIRDAWSNVTVSVEPDDAATDDELATHHLILIGRPAANRATKALASAFPVRFGPASATVNGELYAHERTAVIAAGANPKNGRYSAVVVGGLSADATYHAATELGGRYGRAAEVLVVRGGRAVPVLVSDRPAAARR
jgi:hypothetical protein